MPFALLTVLLALLAAACHDERTYPSFETPELAPDDGTQPEAGSVRVDGARDAAAVPRDAASHDAALVVAPPAVDASPPRVDAGPPAPRYELVEDRGLCLRTPVPQGLGSIDDGPTCNPRTGVCVTGRACMQPSDCRAYPNGRCSAALSAACDAGASCPPRAIRTTACNYDLCASDSDCYVKQRCACTVGARLCVPAQCFSDADCGPGQECRREVPCSDPEFAGGYFCSTPRDGCRSNADCKPSPTGDASCRYQHDESRWRCDFTCNIDLLM